MGAPSTVISVNMGASLLAVALLWACSGTVAPAATDPWDELSFLLAHDDAERRPALRTRYAERWRRTGTVVDGFFWSLVADDEPWRRHLQQRLADDPAAGGWGWLAQAIEAAPALVDRDERWSSDGFGPPASDDESNDEVDEDGPDPCFLEAGRLLDEGLRRDPRNSILVYMRGCLHERLDETTAAADCFARALDLQPTVSVTNYAVGAQELPRADGSRAAAIAALRRALELDRAWLWSFAHQHCSVALAERLCLGDDGVWGGPGSDLVEAEAVLRRGLSVEGTAKVFVRTKLLELLVRRRWFDEAAAVAAAAADDPVRPPHYDDIWSYRRLVEGPTAIRRDGAVVRLHLPHVHCRSDHLWLVGDFNRWQPAVHALVPLADGGGFEAVVPADLVPPGVHRYGVQAEVSEGYLYDPAAPDFEGRASAFVVRPDGTVATAPRSAFAYRMGRYALAPTSLDEGPEFTELVEALRVRPSATEALVALAPRLVGERAALFAGTPRPAGWGSGHEACLRLFGAEASNTTTAAQWADLAATRAGGLDGAPLRLAEARLLPSGPERTDKILRALQLDTDDMTDARYLLMTCTAPADLAALGRLADDDGTTRLRTLYADRLAALDRQDEALARYRSDLPARRREGAAAYWPIVSIMDARRRQALRASTGRTSTSTTVAVARNAVLDVLEEALNDLPDTRTLHARYFSHTVDDDEYAPGLHRATTFLERLAAAHPDSPTVAANLAVCLARQGDERRTRDLFERALDRCPGWRWALVEYGEFLKDRGLDGAAERHLMRAWRLDRSNAYPAGLVADMLRGRHQGDKRRDLLEQALAATAHPEQAGWLRTQLYQLYMARPDGGEKALALARRELTAQRSRCKPDHARVGGMLVTAALKAGRPQDVLSAVRLLDGSFTVGCMVVATLAVVFVPSALALLVVAVLGRNRPVVLGLTAAAFLVWLHLTVQSAAAFAASFALHGRFLAFMDPSRALVGPAVVQAALACTLFVCLPVAALVTWLRGEGRTPLGLWRRPRAGEVLAGLAAGGGLVLLQWLVTTVLTWTCGGPPTGLVGLPDEPSLARLMHLSRFGCLLTLLNVVLLAPLYEELVFRGFCYRLARPVLGRPLALLGAASLFALLRFGAVVHLFAVAVVLSLLYDRMQGLWTPVVAHMTMDAAAIAWAYLHVY